MSHGYLLRPKNQQNGMLNENESKNKRIKINAIMIKATQKKALGVLKFM